MAASLRSPTRPSRDLILVGGISAVAILVISSMTGDGGSRDANAGTVASTPPLSAPAPSPAPDANVSAITVVGNPSAGAGTSTTAVVESGAIGVSAGSCTLTERSLRQGQSGAGVTCLQEALSTAGFAGVSATGTFDSATEKAVRELQTSKDLYVDGVVGRETAIELGIWPDEESLIVRTPQPPKGAVDLLGYPLSSVATAGADAPPLPENSGSGRRLVYSRAGQRVWAVDEDGDIIRSWLVSGSKYPNELPGTHKIYSRSEVSTAWNGKAFLPYMVRWLDTERGALGFHSIPLHVEDNSPYQTEDELGQRLSGGCQRQAPADAAFVWNFGTIGTTVVVV